jgi:AcrR family transcriptional regulator
MAPRSYTLGRRAETSTATRRRILDATLQLYREVGVSGATLTAVARRADVARGTILNHFGSGEGLLRAALEAVLETLELPDAHALRDIEDPETRIRAFVAGMLEFQDKSSHWWTVFEGEMQRPELRDVEARYWAILADLQAAALGPELRDDPAANATLTSIVHPATVGTFHWAFEQAGLPRADARPLLEAVAVDAIRRIADGAVGKGGLA